MKFLSSATCGVQSAEYHMSTVAQYSRKSGAERSKRQYWLTFQHRLFSSVMVETNWRAVAFGFITIFLLTFVSTAFDQLALLGGVVAGLLGGWVAGYYARAGSVSGAWNGLLSGTIGAILVVSAFVALGLAVSVVELSLGGALATVGLGVAILALAAISAIPAVVGGYIGGMYPRREADETGRPAA